MNLRTFSALVLLLACVLSVQAAPIPGTAASRGAANDIADLDHLLDLAKPGQTSVFVGDMGLRVSALTQLRQALARRESGKLHAHSAFDAGFTKWPGGTVPYTFAGVSADHQTLILKACADWAAVANVHFTQRTTETEYVAFTDSTSGNWSYVGKIGGGQPINIQDYYEFLITHEIGHALGLIHEQSRSDRDQYVTINSQNLQAGTEGDFSIVPGSLNQGAYDFDSDMHYFLTAFSANGQPTLSVNAPYSAQWNGSNVGQQSHLSAGDKSGMAAIYGPLVPAPAAVPTHLLWTNTNGAAAVWTVSASGPPVVNTYGPFAGWTAKAIADGGTDGKTRVLWGNTDGTLSLWSLDNSTASYTHAEFGPYPGWTATALSVSPGGVTHVLWNHTSGAVSVWSVAGGGITHHEYGPFPGWTVKVIADGGADGKTRLLWTQVSGLASLWNLSSTDGAFTHAEFGPFGGWTATAISVAPDSAVHILWNNTNGVASIWNYSGANGSFTHREYGPFTGYTAKTIADGSSAGTQMRVLWNRTDGTASLWNLGTSAGAFSHAEFGAFADWTALGTAAP